MAERRDRSPGTAGADVEADAAVAGVPLADVAVAGMPLADVAVPDVPLADVEGAVAASVPAAAAAAAAVVVAAAAFSDVVAVETVRRLGNVGRLCRLLPLPITLGIVNPMLLLTSCKGMVFCGALICMAALEFVMLLASCKTPCNRYT